MSMIDFTNQTIEHARRKLSKLRSHLPYARKDAGMDLAGIESRISKLQAGIEDVESCSKSLAGDLPKRKRAELEKRLEIAVRDLNSVAI